MSATGQGHFWPQGNNLNKLSRGSLGEAMYQNIKDLGLLLSEKNIFIKFFPLLVYVKQVTPRL